jgi:alpha-ketoglutarate-dependent taurine dioxygenase
MSVTVDAPLPAIEPLSLILGAEVIGLDLRRPLGETMKRVIYDALVRYHVLCFRDRAFLECCTEPVRAVPRPRELVLLRAME